MMADDLNQINAVLQSKDQEYHFSQEVVPKRRIAFGGNLRSLARVEKYVWYTPAMLYLWGRFSDTPLIDITRRVDCPVLWYRFDKPLFRGLSFGEDHSWNHTLWACPREKWEAFVDAVLETAQFDLPRRLLYTYALQSLQVYDPLVVDHTRFFVPGATAKIDVHAFAICTNKHRIVFPAAVSAEQLPAPNRIKPERSMIRLAANFFVDTDLTSDNAFGRYKEFLLKQNDAEFELLKAQFLAKTRKAKS